MTIYFQNTFYPLGSEGGFIRNMWYRTPLEVKLPARRQRGLCEHGPSDGHQPVYCMCLLTVWPFRFSTMHFPLSHTSYFPQASQFGESIKSGLFGWCSLVKSILLKLQIHIQLSALPMCVRVMERHFWWVPVLRSHAPRWWTDQMNNYCKAVWVISHMSTVFCTVQ